MIARKPKTETKARTIRSTSNNGSAPKSIGGSASLLLRLPDDLAAALTMQAEDARMSRNNFIVKILEDHITAVKKAGKR